LDQRPGEIAKSNATPSMRHQNAITAEDRQTVRRCSRSNRQGMGGLSEEEHTGRNYWTAMVTVLLRNPCSLIPTRIVPHQLRHTYASEMVRAGVGLPALMKLLGHVNPEMTMRYVDVAGSDLQREFHLARLQPRHLAPQPKAPSSSPRGGLDGVIDSLLFAQHAIEMFRRSLPDGARKHSLDQLANRLTKILAETRKISPAG
jgi:hypothetical protein